LDSKESKKLLELEDVLSDRIIGQDDAIKLISKAIRRNRVGIKDHDKPIGSFIFLGSTGVGKTYLAKTLAEILFGDKDKIIRIDMSEYMEKHNVSKLIGAPPGYVGYDEGGQLTEKIKNNPFSVILLDEIEKAHKDVYNILLQILDEGHLTDSFGRKINFTNTLIIMTSNVGAKSVSEYGNGIGFQTTSTEKQNYEVKKSIIQKALKKQFNPEFLNRVDDIILFNALGEDVLKKIITIEIDRLRKRLEDKNYKINFDKTITDKVFELNNQEEYGARPIKRIIQNLCEDFISEEVLRGNIEEGVEITLKYKNDKINIMKK
jgi:ATP-dependent Clp protease ATP-binding subunit ClpC